MLAWEAPADLAPGAALDEHDPEYQRAVLNTEDAWAAAQFGKDAMTRYLDTAPHEPRPRSRATVILDEIVGARGTVVGDRRAPATC